MSGCADSGITKSEFTNMVRDHVISIYGLCEQYGTADYLSIVLMKDSSTGMIMFNNRYWADGAHEKDGKDIDYYECL